MANKDTDTASVDLRIAEAVNHAIEQSGIKKTALCDKTGMPYSTLTSKLRAYSPFTVAEIYRIATVLNVHPLSLMVAGDPQGLAA